MRMCKDNKSLYDLFNEDDKIPDSIRAKKENSFNEIRKMENDKKMNNGFSIKKKLIASIAVFLLILGIGTPIAAHMKWRFLDGRDKGVQEAIDNNYDQNLDGVFAKSNGVTLELTNVITDPTVIALRFKITSEENINKIGLDTNKKCNIAFNIIDDRERVIQGYDNIEGIYSGKVESESGEIIRLSSGGSESLDMSNADEDILYYDYMITSTEGNLKDIKGLTIETDSIGELVGEWKLQVEFDKEITGSTNREYDVVKTSEKIEVIQAKQMATGLLVKFIVKGDVDENIVAKTKIEDSEGNLYGTNRAATLGTLNDGNNEVEMIFETSKFNVLERFNLVIDGFDEKVEFKLK